jgi:type IV pilus assembly protein PilW
MFLTRANRGHASSQRGLSLVELMVGIALGLFLVAGASTLFVSHLNNSRRLLLEARLNQDLRAVADLVTRDLRRAGYWGNPLQGTVVAAGASSPTANPYATVTPGTGTITYDFSRDVTEDNTRSANERFVFDLNGGVIRMTIGAAAPQPVTDPDTMTVTEFTIAPTETPVDIRDSCAKTCTGGGCPTITVRQYLVTIKGRATRDPTVTRTMQTRTRVRNDAFAGVCPA